MNVKKSLLVAGAATTMGVAGLTGLGVASAATPASDMVDGKSSLVDKLAAKFNLNKEDVREVFDEAQNERELAHKQRLEERLNTAVAEGKLTEDQKEKILTKISELEAERESDREQLKAMPQEERYAAMKEKAEALKAWMDEHDIPEEYMPIHRKVMKGAPGMMEGAEPLNDSANEI